MGERRYLRSWFYWLCFACGIGAWFLIGGFLGVLAGINPYIGGSLGGGGFVLYEAWQVSRHG